MPDQLAHSGTHTAVHSAHDPAALVATAAPGELVAADAAADAATGAVLVATTPSAPTRRSLGLVFWIAFAWVLGMALLAILASLQPLPNPNFQNYSAVNVGPSLHHLLGTTTWAATCLAASPSVRGCRSSSASPPSGWAWPSAARSA